MEALPSVFQGTILEVILSCALSSLPTSDQSWYFNPEISVQPRLLLCPRSPWRVFLPPKFSCSISSDTECRSPSLIEEMGLPGSQTWQDGEIWGFYFSEEPVSPWEVNTGDLGINRYETCQRGSPFYQTPGLSRCQGLSFLLGGTTSLPTLLPTLAQERDPERHYGGVPSNLWVWSWNSPLPGVVDQLF